MNFPSESAPEESGHGISEVVERLHRELADPLERIAWAIVRDWQLAADAVQETFWLLAEKFPEIPAENHRGWLVKTVQNQSRNLRRKRQRAESLPERLSKSGLVRQVNEEHRQERAQLEQRDEQEKLRQAIASLPEPQRRIVQLRLADERSFAEIASELNLPLGTVLSRMRLALEKLRKMLEP